MVSNWTLRKRPLMLERRIDFDNYDLTREFLDKSADLSEQAGVYPDMNFARTHVSMTLTPDGDEFSETQLSFAEQINGFASSNTINAPITTTCAVEMN